jgi:hypothetical protein
MTDIRLYLVELENNNKLEATKIAQGTAHRENLPKFHPLKKRPDLVPQACRTDRLNSSR